MHGDGMVKMQTSKSSLGQLHVRWLPCLCLGFAILLCAVVQGADPADPLMESESVASAATVSAPETLLYYGRFHLVILHLPIGLLAGLFVLESVALLRHWPAYKGAAWLLLGMGSASAVVAAALGLFLSWNGGYDAELLFWHQWLGIGVAGLTLLLLFLKRFSAGRAGRAVYWVFLLICMSVLGAAGHEGASLTHGPGYLTENLPPRLSELFGAAKNPADELANAAAAQPPLSEFTATIQPILATNCLECHGAGKQRGGLRLDNRAGALHAEAGEVAAIIPGDALASELIRRVTLPEGAEDLMPPGNKPRVSPEEIIMLIDWINKGARWEDPLEVMEREVSAAPQSAIASVRVLPGAIVAPLKDGSPLLRVELQQVEHVGDAELAALAPLAANIVWLNLAGAQLTDAGLEQISSFTNLTMLYLNYTPIGDAGLAHLAGLPKLEYLNLVGTAVTDAGLESLASMKSLRKLYLWRTGATHAGVDRLRSVSPDLLARLGEDPATTPTQTVAPVATLTP